MRPAAMTFKRTYIISMLVGLCLALGFAGGYLVRDRLFVRSDQYPLFGEAYDILDKHGLKPIPTEPLLEYSMIRGVLGAYQDPYTIFVEPAQHELESDALQGSFGGIGVQLIRDAGGQIILNPFPDSPAQLAGVREGDILVAVDDLLMSPELSMEAIQAALRGQVGQIVLVKLQRPPELNQYEYKISRAEFSIPSVTWRIDVDHAGLGIVEVNLISASTPDEVQEAVMDLQSRGATAFIMDLRNNSGGLLAAGVDIARLFLDSGVVMEHQYRDQKIETFRVEKPGPFIQLPLVLLVNENTASAAEIIAGALKAHGRATIIGMPTYGKDSIQLVFSLKDGSSLHVTAAQWWIPGLEPPIGEGGLQPDIQIAGEIDPNQSDPAVKAAADVLSR